MLRFVCTAALAAALVGAEGPPMGELLAGDDECQGEAEQCALNALQRRSKAQQEEETEELTEVPRGDGAYSDEGPYDEVPDEKEADNPRAALEGWNTTSLASTGWGHDSFCQSHHTGFFCFGTTRTRCCRRGRFYRECGSTVHSTKCGWHGVDDHGYHQGYPSYHDPGYGHPGYGQPGYSQPGYGYGGRRRYGGGGGLHPGWHMWTPPGGFDHYCESHHVGRFCDHHTTISCCKRGWHYVSCTTTTRSHSYC